MSPFLNAPVSPNIVLLTDENYGCNYVGARVLVSRGNVFLFVASLRGFEVGYGLFYASLYLVFHVRELYRFRGIYVHRHGQNSVRRHRLKFADKCMEYLSCTGWFYRIEYFARTHARTV